MQFNNHNAQILYWFFKMLLFGMTVVAFFCCVWWEWAHVPKCKKKQTQSGNKIKPHTRNKKHQKLTYVFFVVSQTLQMKVKSEFATTIWLCFFFFCRSLESGSFHTFITERSSPNLISQNISFDQTKMSSEMSLTWQCVWFNDFQSFPHHQNKKQNKTPTNRILP